MRIRRKIIAMLLILTILSPFVPNLTSFANSPVFSLSVAGVTDASVAAAAGDTVAVDINLEDGLLNQRMLNVILGYDATMLEPQADSESNGEKSLNTAGSLNGAIAPGYTIATGLIGSGDITITFATTNSIVESGKIGTIYFKVLQEGATDVTITSASYVEDPESEDAALNTPQVISTSSKITVSNPVPMTGLTVNSTSLLMNKGGTKSVIAQKVPDNTTNTDKIVWTTDNAAVATVDDGFITAVGPGSATITASCGGFTAEIKVEVKSPLSGVSVSETELLLNKGDTFQLTAERIPSDTTSSSRISWVSLDSNIATVTQTGLVTAVGAGEGTLRVQCGAFSKDIKVTVIAPLVGISFEEDEMALDLGAKATLKLIKDPIDTTDTTPTEWSSSNEEVVSVDENGNIEGLAHGRAVITARVGTYKALIAIVVSAHIESIEILNDNLDENRTIELQKGQSTDLDVTFKPDIFAESRTIKWESNADNIVKVENGTITAVAPGEAKITATTVNNIKDTITVKVPVVNAETLVIDRSELSMEKGESLQLSAIIQPDNTTDDKTVTWKTTDGSVVSVDENGVVTAVGVGTATITAKVAGLYASCPVTVTCSLQAITLNETDIKAEVGVPVIEVLTVSKVPEDASIDVAETIWRSLNETVATVENGIITAVGPGTAVIEAELGGRIARCKVTVKVNLEGVEFENADKTLELKVGQMTKLKPQFLPANATEIPLATWSSSDESVATVDDKGLITALEQGETKITVDYGNGIKASRMVKVSLVHADSVVFDKKIETLIKGEEAVLVAKLVPDKSVDEISWSTSDESIATVDQNGNVKAIKSGKVVITATASNGKFANMEITVKEQQLEFVTLTLEKTELKEGEKTKSTIKFNPETITDNVTITYVSSDESMATVDNYGIVTAKKAGEVIITVDVIAINDAGDEKGFSSQVDLKILEVPMEDGQIKEEDQKPDAGNDSENNNQNGEENKPGDNPENNNSTEDKKDETTTEDKKEETNKTQNSTSTAVEGLVTSPHTGDMNIKALAVMMLVSIAGMFTRFKTIDLIINK